MPSTPQALEKIIQPAGNSTGTCHIENSPKNYTRYEISNCETIHCEYGGDDCQSSILDTVWNVTCEKIACCNVDFKNIQEGATILCQGDGACMDSAFTPAVVTTTSTSNNEKESNTTSNTTELASFTVICDNESPKDEDGACAFTSFEQGLGPNGALLCGRNRPCHFVSLGMQDYLEDDPELCIMCAFPDSCGIFEDIHGAQQITSVEDRRARTIGKGCTNQHLAQLCDFYKDDYYAFIDLNGDELDDCRGGPRRRRPTPLFVLLLGVFLAFLYLERKQRKRKRVYFHDDSNSREAKNLELQLQPLLVV